MAITVESVPFGPRAFTALGAAVARAQAGDRLAPVTVVAPTNTAGVMMRRWLGRHGGVAGTQFVTLYRLAEMLAGARLAAEGRRPVTNPVMAAVLQRVLAETPGPLHGTAPHSATIDALIRLHRELRELDRPMLRRLAQFGSPLGRAVHDVHVRARELLAAGWHDEGDLVDAAARDLDPARLAALGPILLVLPQRISPSGARLVRTLGQVTEVHVIVGLAGDEEADAPVHTLCDLLGMTVPAAAAAERFHIDVLDVTDADDEVRAAVRELLSHARDGVPFDRMAVLFTNVDPYLRTLAEQLATAGLPWNGTNPLRATERVAPRTLLAALDLDRRAWRIADVFSLLGGAPIVGADGRPAPVAAWERVARDAAVRGGDDWDGRLADHAQREQRRYVANRRADDEADDTVTESPRARAALDLRAFVLDLLDRLGDPAATRRWDAWATLAHGMARHLLGGERSRRRLPIDEQRAFDQLEATIDRLATLDEFLDPVDRAGFRQALATDLDKQLSRHSHVGQGVYVGPLSTAVTLDVDVVVVLGAVDGSFPRPVQGDPLLGESDRRLADLPERPGEATRSDQRRSWLAALAGAPRVVVGAARGDLRRSALRRPTRWLDELEPTNDVHRLTHASHLDALATTGFPVHDGEFIGRSLLTHLRSGGAYDEHPAVHRDGVLAAGRRMLRARAEPRLTEFDGDLSGEGVPAPFDSGSPVAPTRLERWASCPYAYFMRHVLHIDADEGPADDLLISPLDKGALIHEVLERFGRAVLAEGGWPAQTAWSGDHRDLVHRLLDEISDERAKLGLTGHAALWAYDLARLHADLDVALGFDDAVRAADGRWLAGTETAFGTPDSAWTAPVIRLANGRAIALRGAVDRVDRTDGGVVVVDYKSGSGSKYEKVSADQPLGDGTLLQLGAYAAAATQAFDLPMGMAVAEYRFVERTARHKQVGFPLTDGVWSAFTEALEVITDGIADGLFPARPAPPVWQVRVQCHYCDPDGAGTGDRHREWLAKRADPRLTRFLALVGDASGDDENG